ncbi:MAG: PQQ-dependent sugar dehydrogenase [Anaerolineaceae bacterium]|nr:PQQ-dependent sugar dehydrogenase [Anaerolineaceae bacterium]
MRATLFSLSLGIAMLVLTACQTTPSAMPATEPASLTSTFSASATETDRPIAATSFVTPEISGQADVDTFPNLADFSWQPVVNGLDRPLDIVSSKDGTGRLFVVEQTGKIQIVQQNELLPRPFLDLSDAISQLNSNQSEQGLLGLAFPPDFHSSQVFYVNYTNRSGASVISRFRASPDSDIAERSSEEMLLQIEQPYSNHNGGKLQFGPDGYLYIGLGDGGGRGDPDNNGQNPNTLLGTILRIDVSDSTGYTIPEDNPFIQNGGQPEIWAWGLRNPWKFSFDSLTGDLYIADVGQDAWEEINYLPAGSPGGVNFGWNFLEGSHSYRGTPPENGTFVDPVYEYDHAQGKSVTGGYVYRGQALPAFYGMYIFGDFISGRIWGMLPCCGEAEEIFQTGAYISTFGEDENGELYFGDYQQGVIYRLERK